MARPRKENPRNTRLITRVTHDQATHIREQAKSHGLTVSDYIASAALGNKISTTKVPAINRSLYLELSRYNSNLNQIAHHLNEGRLLIDSNGIIQHLLQMYEVIRKVRQELRGDR